MIDPNNIINYERTDAELEELILFLIAVAGKNAERTAKQLARFLHKPEKSKITPFGIIKYKLANPVGSKGIGRDKEGTVKMFRFTNLVDELKAYGFGCQTRLAKAFTEIANSGINLRICTLEDLMQIHGIGRKSASCFLAWTRPKQRVAQARSKG